MSGQAPSYEKFLDANRRAKRYVDNTLGNLIQPIVHSATLPTTGWTLDNNETSPYKYYFDLPADVNPASIVNITPAPAGVATAIACGLCPAVETSLGVIRFRSTAPLTSPIDIQYWAVQGVAPENALTVKALTDTAPAHNALYRGLDLTSYFNSGEMSIDLADENFANIYPGDYIIKSITVDGTTYEDVKWIIGDLDYDINKWNGEDSTVIDHHVLVFPEKCIGTAQMNATNTTAGGFLGSTMWTETLPKYAAGITAAFGEAHVLTHKEFLTNAVNTSAYSAAGSAWKGTVTSVNWDSVDVVCNLFNEVQIYGTTIFSGSGFDSLQDPRQVSAFRHNPSLYFDKNQWYWLRSVASASFFCGVDDGGGAGYYGASGVGGVRPFSLLR